MELVNRLMQARISESVKSGFRGGGCMVLFALVGDETRDSTLLGTGEAKPLVLANQLLWILAITPVCQSDIADPKQRITTAFGAWMPWCLVDDWHWMDDACCGVDCQMDFISYHSASAADSSSVRLDALGGEGLGVSGSGCFRGLPRLAGGNPAFFLAR